MVPPQIRIRDPQSIRNIASPAFRSGNTFMIDDPSQAMRWLEQVSREQYPKLGQTPHFFCTGYHLGPYLDLCGSPPNGPK